jgi:YHS domain-containing protein
MQGLSGVWQRSLRIDMLKASLIGFRVASLICDGTIMLKFVFPLILFAIATVLIIPLDSHELQASRSDGSGIRIALDGDCTVSLVEMQAYVKGDKKFESTYRGLRYQFLSEEEKTVFDACPEMFAVAFKGVDIVATYGLDGPLDAKEVTYGVGRNTHRFEDKIYHFASEKNFRLFVKQPSEYIARAKQALYLDAERKRGKSMSELYPVQ